MCVDLRSRDFLNPGCPVKSDLDGGILSVHDDQTVSGGRGKGFGRDEWSGVPVDSTGGTKTAVSE